MRIRTFVTAILATLLSTSLIIAASSAPQTTDLTEQSRAAGLKIRNLRAFEVGGVVILRGVAADRATAEEAGRVATTLGYLRVANLVRVAPPTDDIAIERLAERELAVRPLDGCTFHVDSQDGVLYVKGHVVNELQRDMAIELLRNIDGVKSVHAELLQR
jgi:osmotically-inducible protein OsmY